MTSTYGPEIQKLKLIDSIFYYTPLGVWAPGIAFPAGYANPIETSSNHDKDFYYGVVSGHLWQYQGTYPTGGWVDLGTGANAITWCGTAVPSSGEGNDRDFFNKYDSGEIYQKINGAWRNVGTNKNGLPLSTAALNFTDSYKTWRSANLGLLLVSDDGDAPLLATDSGFVVKKDITAGGFIGANQGELWLGHGRANATDNPKIVLMHSTGSYFAQQHPGQAYDTLYLTRIDCSTPTHLDLGNLTAHGDIITSGQLSLVSGGDLKASFKYIPGNGTSVITCEHNNLVIQCLGGDGTYGDVVLYPAVNSCVVVWGGRWLVPQNANTGMVGNHSNRYFYEGAFYNSYGHSAGYFDAYDDLAIVKQWGEPNPKLPDDYDSSKTKPKSRNPFAILKGSTEEKESDDSELYNFGKMNSFALGCAKALAKKLDEDEATLLEMFNKIETQQNEIDTLRSQIQKLTATGGVNA